ncbi:hypothetical protein CLV98_107111 [Dyadobacter jejuensis]|uniref:Uncharacterized protein n=2 Tax=Dyadobacter jejuensis TaxID=1082580 RepID=A0A316AK67_9BACT|nr:hypothetical protein CLV98_107111 [Dyadobacter jejuensis]
MGIKNDGELHSKTELEIIKRENDDLKKALGESTLEIKVLKKIGPPKRLEMDLLRNKKLNRYP